MRFHFTSECQSFVRANSHESARRWKWEEIKLCVNDISENRKSSLTRSANRVGAVDSKSTPETRVMRFLCFSWNSLSDGAIPVMVRGPREITFFITPHAWNRWRRRERKNFRRNFFNYVSFFLKEDFSSENTETAMSQWLRLPKQSSKSISSPVINIANSFEWIHHSSFAASFETLRVV